MVPVVKRFQAEIDSLSKRCKMAEAAFLAAYQRFANLPGMLFSRSIDIILMMGRGDTRRGSKRGHSKSGFSVPPLQLFVLMTSSGSSRKIYLGGGHSFLVLKTTLCESADVRPT